MLNRSWDTIKNNLESDKFLTWTYYEGNFDHLKTNEYYENSPEVHDVLKEIDYQFPKRKRVIGRCVKGQIEVDNKLITVIFDSPEDAGNRINRDQSSIRGRIVSSNYS